MRQGKFFSSRHLRPRVWALQPPLAVRRSFGSLFTKIRELSGFTARRVRGEIHATQTAGLDGFDRCGRPRSGCGAGGGSSAEGEAVRSGHSTFVERLLRRAQRRRRVGEPRPRPHGADLHHLQFGRAGHRVHRRRPGRPQWQYARIGCSASGDINYAEAARSSAFAFNFSSEDTVGCRRTRACVGCRPCAEGWAIRGIVRFITPPAGWPSVA